MKLFNLGKFWLTQNFTTAVGYICHTANMLAKSVNNSQQITVKVQFECENPALGQEGDSDGDEPQEAPVKEKLKFKRERKKDRFEGHGQFT